MGAFDEIVIQEARPLPLLVLADTSGSMSHENHIGILNEAMREMIASLKDVGSLRAEVSMAVITFGNGGVQAHQKFTPIKEIIWQDLQANERTPMGGAFQLVRQLIEDKEIIPSRSYRPTIVLLSDGLPTDEWEQPLQDLLESPRASKAFRIAMSIGAGNKGMNVLNRFMGDAELGVFSAEQARDIKKFFKFVTMSVNQRTQSQDPNLNTPGLSYDDVDDFDEFEF